MTLPDRTLVTAALDALIRESELLALDWQDDAGAYLTVLNAKNGHTRHVPVSSRLRRRLDALKRHTGGQGRIFAHRRRANRTPRQWAKSVRDMFKAACHRAGIAYGRTRGGLTFHGLRHTGASRMVAEGVSLRDIQAIGGWEDLTSLMRYLHPTEEGIRHAVNLVGQRRRVSRAVSRTESKNSENGRQQPSDDSAPVIDLSAIHGHDRSNY